jgi:hypothetical protein
MKPGEEGLINTSPIKQKSLRENKVRRYRYLLRRLKLELISPPL